VAPPGKTGGIAYAAAIVSFHLRLGVCFSTAPKIVPEIVLENAHNYVSRRITL